MGKKIPISLKQNPHEVQLDLEQRLELAIGHEIRAARKRLGITIAELSDASGLSVGMVSKMENGSTSPSLASLQIMSDALGVPISSFFKRFEETRAAVHVKAGEGFEAERRGTRAGHQFKLLGHIGGNTSGVTVEPYLITLTEESDTFPAFQHDGLEFLYMLEGEIEYRHGNKYYVLKPGDSLYFDADAPHGPATLSKLPAVYLSVISYQQPE